MTCIISLDKVLEVGTNGIKLDDKILVSGKVAFSKHAGFINPFTKHYARYTMNIPSEYRRKDDEIEDSPIFTQNLDKYYKAVQIDRILSNSKVVKTIKIDGRNGLAYDAILGARFLLQRRKPNIIITHDITYDKIHELLNDILKLNYHMTVRKYDEVPEMTFFTGRTLQ